MQQCDKVNNLAAGKILIRNVSATLFVDNREWLNTIKNLLPNMVILLGTLFPFFLCLPRAVATELKWNVRYFYFEELLLHVLGYCSILTIINAVSVEITKNEPNVSSDYLACISLHIVMVT